MEEADDVDGWLDWLMTNESEGFVELYEDESVACDEDISCCVDSADVDWLPC